MTKEEIIEPYLFPFDEGEIKVLSRGRCLQVMEEYAKQCVREALVHVNEKCLEYEGVNFGDDFPDKYISEKFKK